MAYDTYYFSWLRWRGVTHIYVGCTQSPTQSDSNPSPLHHLSINLTFVNIKLSSYKTKHFPHFWHISFISASWWHPSIEFAKKFSEFSWRQRGVVWMSWESNTPTLLVPVAKNSFTTASAFIVYFYIQSYRWISGAISLFQKKIFLTQTAKLRRRSSILRENPISTALGLALTIL